MKALPEATIQKELYDLLKSWKPFKVQISGFDKFTTKNTLFLEVSAKEIIDIQNNIVAVLRQRAKIGKKGTQKLRHPHITIASAIPDFHFQNCLNYFMKKEYQEKFVVDKISVLRRNFSIEKAAYQTAFEVKLKG